MKLKIGPSDSCSSNDKLCKPKLRDKDKTKTEQEIPYGGTNMNMRELGANPGDVRMQKKTSAESLTPGQEQAGRAAEKKIGIQKLRIKKRKEMGY